MWRVAIIGVAFTGATLVAQPERAQTGGREPFAIADQAVPAGRRVDVDLQVPAGTTDPATYIPVSVFHGTRPGPVLALTMGVHGFEYRRRSWRRSACSDRSTPAASRGTVIMVRIAHVESFEQRVPFVNPFDRKNLNRVFPGRMDGTQAERIAWALTSEVIRRADLHIEIHGGDGAEWLEAFAGPYGGPLAASQWPKAREMALAFGFRNVVKYSMNTQEQVDQGRSLNRQAVADGKPTVLIEIGENGRRDDAFVEPVVSGVVNLLRVLKMAEGPPSTPRSDTRWFDDTTGVSATHTGLFTPVATTARNVHRGEVLGTIRDYAGRVVETIVSPLDGYVLYGIAGPPVRAGDTVATIGLPSNGPL